MAFGPGARAFVVDYRLSPEDPFPAAVHDIFASFLYLTQPDHPAISPLHKRDQWDHPLEPVDPRDVVLAGDSAGGGLAIAFMLYMRDYVQPALSTQLTVPSTTILLSAWTDISTSMPAASVDHSYCYVPCPMGVNPFADQATFEAFPRQAGAFDRLVDDTKLYAHKLGQANPASRVRFELYQEQVHVFQFFEFLPMASKAMKSIVFFVDSARESAKSREGQRTRSRKSAGKGTEWVVVDYKGNETEGYKGTSVTELDRRWSQTLADK
ncbi:hypothetical protein BG000_008163 [Podila horticola]|nr:hypothetical protein BG000_008163 [Podila horticola]